jgi:hypothetical protein
LQRIRNDFRARFVADAQGIVTDQQVAALADFFESSRGQRLVRVVNSNTSISFTEEELFSDEPFT